MRLGLFAAAVLFISIFALQEANAAQRVASGLSTSALGGGNTQFGVGFSVVTAGQNDLNSVIDSNRWNNAASTSELGSAYEFYINYVYRFSSSDYAFVLRPSYFTQSQTGSGTGGSYDFKLTGFTLFPIFRMYALESPLIHFYFQAGVGYGQLNGDITAGANDLKFQGNSFGAIGGMGVDLCFTPSSCITIEGNLRYLPVERNISNGGNCVDGTSTAISGISQCGGSKEVEAGGTDLRTTMSGVQGLVGYTMNF